MTIIISGNRAVCNHMLVRESLAVFGRAPKAEKAIIVDSRARERSAKTEKKKSIIRQMWHKEEDTLQLRVMG